jgi:hypothetical protein
MVIDRLEREREYGELRCEKPIIDYFRSDRFFVGCEGNEARCPTSSIESVRRLCVCVGLFRTKSRWETHCIEINEILERKDINDKHKAMILGENAKSLRAKFSPIALKMRAE